MKISVGAATDIGRVRERNEDAFLVQEPLFAVADGMGGHRGGNVASLLAMETLESFRMPSQGAASALLDDIRKANLRVMERGESDRDLRGMGTTITAVVAENSRAHVAHVGDSRAYLFREGNLQQLTEDHTLVQRMVREGKLTQEEAGHHPQRSVLTRALGVEGGIDIDELTLDVHPGDRILLCTDGLTSMLDDRSIQEILHEEVDPQSAANRLVTAANEAGGEDNVTVVILEFREDGGDGSGPEQGAGVAPAPETVASTAGRGDGASQGDAGATAVVAVSTPAQEPAAPSPAPAEERRSERGRGRRRRRALLALVLLVLVLAAAIGSKVFIDRQWYVGDSEGRVAIYNGIPTRLIGYRLSHVTETTDLSASQAEQLQPWRDLGDGISAKSLPDARSIVAQIRSDLTASSGGGG